MSKKTQDGSRLHSTHVYDYAPNQRKFLAALRICGRVDLSARWAHITRGAHYEWLKHDPSYPARFGEAMEQSAQAMEDEAKRRAFAGVKRDVRYRGRIVGSELHYSDVLVPLLLKGAMPDKYSDRSKIDVTVQGEIELRARLEAGRQRAAGLDGVAQAELPAAPILERMVDVVPVLEVVKNPEKRDDADILTQEMSLQSIDVSK